MTDEALLALLHEWGVTAERDGGYILSRCGMCGVEELLDLAPATRKE